MKNLQIFSLRREKGSFGTWPFGRKKKRGRTTAVIERRLLIGKMFEENTTKKERNDLRRREGKTSI